MGFYGRRIAVTALLLAGLFGADIRAQQDAYPFGMRAGVPLDERDNTRRGQLSEAPLVYSSRPLGGSGLAVSNEPQGIAFSPDGKCLAAAADVGFRTKVTVWDVKTGSPQRIFFNDGSHFSLAFSADGSTLLNGRWKLNPTSGDSQRLADPSVCAVSADGKRIASFDEAAKSLFVWVVDGDGKFGMGRIEDVPLPNAVYSPDGRQLAVPRQDGRVALVESATAKTQFLLKPNYRATTAATRAIYSPDGSRVALIGEMRSVPIFETHTGELSCTIHGHYAGEEVTAAAFLPDGRGIATVARRDHTIRFWNVETGLLAKALATTCTEMTSLAISPDGNLVAAGGFSASIPFLQVWDLNTSSELHAHRGGESPIVQLAFAPHNSRLLATGRKEGKVHVWNVDDSTPWLSLAGDASGDLQFSPAGRSLAAAGRDGSWNLWRTESDAELLSHGRIGPRKMDESLRVALGEQLLAVGSDLAAIDLLERGTGKKIRTFTVGKPGRVGALALSADGKWLAAGPGREYLDEGQTSVQLWEVETGQVVQKLTFDDSAVRIAFSPDGELVAVSGEQSGLNVWRVADGELLHHFRGPVRFCFSPDGRYLLGQLAEKLQLLELDTGQVCFEQRLNLRVNSELAKLATALAMSVDGRYTACGIGNSVLVSPLAPEGLDAAASSTPVQCVSAWRQLGEADPVAAYQAVWQLTVGGEAAVELLRTELSPLPDPEDKQAVARLIEDLDSDQFEVRQRGDETLRALGADVLSQVKAALAKPAGAEQKYRLMRVAEALQHADDQLEGESLRRLRAISVLERIGTPDAGQELARFAASPGLARETLAAKRALARLEARLGKE